MPGKGIPALCRGGIGAAFASSLASLAGRLRGSALVPPGEDEGLPDGFATTQWSLVLAARTPASSAEALERLCRVYWLPVFVYVRRSGFRREDAEDLTQAFFADILGRDWLDRADPGKGRFRGFLHASVRRFVRDHRRSAGAEKRGGGMMQVDLETVERAEREMTQATPGLGPDEAFDRDWAHTILERAMQRLADEQPPGRRRALFEACRPFLLQPAEAGDYDSVARRFEVTRGTVAVTVHRLGKRYRELVRAEVADTVSAPDAIETELRHLLQAVSGA